MILRSASGFHPMSQIAEQQARADRLRPAAQPERYTAEPVSRPLEQGSMDATRRALILSFGSVLVAWPICIAAQPAQRVFRIGVLSPGTPPPGPLDALKQGLRDLGYEDGRNIAIEWRFSGTTDERLRDLAEELVRLKVDLIVAINTQASLAVKRATATTPIVFARVSDPVRTGLVASFAHPSGNITGFSNFSDELSGKRLAVIRELMPTASRLAVLWNTGNPGIELSVREMERANSHVGLELHLLGERQQVRQREADVLQERGLREP